MIRGLFLFFAITLSVFAFAQHHEEPQKLHTPTGDLYGSLVIPDGIEKFDLVILQPGSGPTDRNGNSPIGVSANSYRLLAEALAKKNIASLLIDKRGVAASIDAGKDESKLVFVDYIKDLELWANLLKKDKRVQKLVIAGHSEGSLIGMVAAKTVPADKYISIAGPAKPIDQIISWQLKQRAPLLSPSADSMMAKLKKGERVDTIPPLLFSLFRPSVQPYMTSWMQYNPCAEIRKLSIPVLIVQGSTDFQVQEQEGKALSECNSRAQLAIITGMNHVLKQTVADIQQNQSTYTNPSLPISEMLVNEMVRFIKE